MKNLASIALSLGLIVPLTSCNLVPEDVISLEARAIVVDQAETDLAGVTEDDVDLSGYGVHAALMTGIVDVVGGIDQREFEDSDTPELNVGLRKRLINVWMLEAYVEGVLRYGVDLEQNDVSEDYFGYAAGFGALIDVGPNMFLNARVMWDTTDIDAGITDIDVEGLIGTIGLGFRF